MPQQNTAPLPSSLSEALCEQSEGWKVARRRDGERGRAPRPQPLARGEISILERSHPSDNPAVPIAAGALGGPGPHPCTAQLCCGCILWPRCSDGQLGYKTPTRDAAQGRRPSTDALPFCWLLHLRNWDRKGFSHSVLAPTATRCSAHCRSKLRRTRVSHQTDTMSLSALKNLWK